MFPEQHLLRNPYQHTKLWCSLEALCVIPQPCVWLYIEYMLIYAHHSPHITFECVCLWKTFYRRFVEHLTPVYSFHFHIKRWNDWTTENTSIRGYRLLRMLLWAIFIYAIAAKKSIIKLTLNEFRTPRWTVVELNTFSMKGWGCCEVDGYQTNNLSKSGIEMETVASRRLYTHYIIVTAFQNRHHWTRSSACVASTVCWSALGIDT